MPKLGEIATIGSGRSYKENMRGSSFMIISSAIDDNGRIVKEKMKRVAKKDISEKHQLQKNDVVLIVKGPRNRVAIVKEENFVCGSACAYLRFNHVKDAKQTYSFLKTAEGQDLLKDMRKGASVPMIRLKDLIEIEMK